MARTFPLLVLAATVGIAAAARTVQEWEVDHSARLLKSSESHDRGDRVVQDFANPTAGHCKRFMDQMKSDRAKYKNNQSVTTFVASHGHYTGKTGQPDGSVLMAFDDGTWDSRKKMWNNDAKIRAAAEQSAVAADLCKKSGVCRVYRLMVFGENDQNLNWKLCNGKTGQITDVWPGGRVNKIRIKLKSKDGEGGEQLGTATTPFEFFDYGPKGKQAFDYYKELAAKKGEPHGNPQPFMLIDDKNYIDPYTKQPVKQLTEQVAKAAAAAAAAAKKNRKSVDAELQSVDHTNANLMAAVAGLGGLIVGVAMTAAVYLRGFKQSAASKQSAETISDSETSQE